VLRYLVIAILALPFVEIAVFVKVGAMIGVMATLLLVALSAIAGGLVLRHQGLNLGRQMQDAVRRNTLPGKTLFDAMAVSAAGFLLLVPGFVTDLVALTLLLPSVRSLLYERLSRNITVVATDGTAPRPRVIELESGDYREP